MGGAPGRDAATRLARHDEILRDAIEAHDGHVVKTTGDGVHAAFATASDAVGAAVDAQLRSERRGWGDDRAACACAWASTPAPAELRDGDYYGTAVNRAARLMSVAHGGQIVVLARHRGAGARRRCRRLDARRPRRAPAPRPRQPERVFQLVASRSSSTTSRRCARSTPSAATCRVQLTSFVGRERRDRPRRRSARRRRASSPSPASAVSARPASRSRWRRSCCRDFRDGAWLCELAPRPTTTRCVAGRRRDARQCSTAPGDARSTAASSSSCAASELLLVLDNCEHLLDAAARPRRRAAPASARTCAMLATSREGLGVEGEQVWRAPLARLPDDDGRRRARVARTRCASSSSARGAAGDVPIETRRTRARSPRSAAASTASRSPSSSPRRASSPDDAGRDRRSGSTSGSGSSPAGAAPRSSGTRRSARPSTGRTRCSTSGRVGLRPPRRVRRAASTPAAAEAVAAGDGIEAWDVVDALTDLVAKSMVISRARESATTRYAMLETLRQYARERLDERDEADTVRRRHAQHYVTVARQTRSRTPQPGGDRVP